MTECPVCKAPGVCPVEEGVTFHRQYPPPPPAERLAAIEALLEEVAAPPATQRWGELVEVVDELRGQFD